MQHRRFLKFVKDYQFDIQYHPGKVNAMADALHRKPFLELATLLNVKWKSLRGDDDLT